MGWAIDPLSQFEEGGVGCESCCEGAVAGGEAVGDQASSQFQEDGRAEGGGDTEWWCLAGLQERVLWLREVTLQLQR